jgi:hypothetical protein
MTKMRPRTGLSVGGKGGKAVSDSDHGGDGMKTPPLTCRPCGVVTLYEFPSPAQSPVNAGALAGLLSEDVAREGDARRLEVRDAQLAERLSASPPRAATGSEEALQRASLHGKPHDL